MNIPGFTAENSVYSASGYYQATAGFGTSSTANDLSMQASAIALVPGLGPVIDRFPPIRCCGFVPMLHRLVCVTRRFSPLEQCHCTHDSSGFPIIQCRPPVNAPLE